MKHTARLRHPLLACALALACGLPVHAAQLGLLQAYEAALQQDPQLRAARAERDASREQAVLGRAQLLPSVSAVYTNSLNHTDVTEAAGTTSTRQYRSTSASVQLRQPLYHPEGLAAWRQGQALSAAGEAQFTAREQDLLVRLFEAYAAVLYAQEQVALAQSQLETLSQQQQVNQRLLKGGEGTRTELLETVAKQQLAQAQWIEAHDALEHQRRLLATLTGLPPGEVAPLLDPATPATAPARTLEQWQDIAQHQNPVLQSLRLQLQASGEDVRRADSGHRPRLDLVASSGRSTSDTVSTYRQTQQANTLGIQLNIPIYSGGAVSSVSRQALARQARTQAELDARTAEVAVEVERQHRLRLSSAQRTRALEQAVASSTLLVEATQKSVAGGVRTNLDVLNARDQLVQARRDLTQARLAHLLAELRLRLAAGVLGEDDLRATARRFVAVSAP
jgi:protease secretion system outer membrane protein